MGGDWYLGLVPLSVFLIVTAVLIYLKILSWKDPLGDVQAAAAEDAGVSSKQENVASEGVSAAPRGINEKDIDLSMVEVQSADLVASARRTSNCPWSYPTLPKQEEPRAGRRSVVGLHQGRM